MCRVRQGRATNERQEHEAAVHQARRWLSRPIIELEWPVCDEYKCSRAVAKMQERQIKEEVAEREAMGAKPVTPGILYRCLGPGCTKMFASRSELQRCSGCKNADYCSVDCQRGAWPAESGLTDSRSRSEWSLIPVLSPVDGRRRRAGNGR
ncbi:hypothetical protein DFJ74DRAFT_658833 [Hyaloraphidium curvatum]|nr:hypothetical protein DFJ74DRAFT_658833 [Hyaloraphidium curvatum]